MEDFKPCPICGSQCKWKYTNVDQQIILYDCPICGKFKTVQIFLDPKTYKPGKHYILSAITRESNELNLPEVIFTIENIEGYLSDSRLPANMESKLDKILLYIYRHTRIAGKYCRIDNEVDYPIAFAFNEEEFLYLLNILNCGGLIETDSNENEIIDSINNLRLTLDGWKRIDQLRIDQRVSGNQCFVAMSFDKNMNDVWENGIRPGILDAKYNPLRVDKEEHNDQITDRIIADIRQSRIMVADFTGQNQGVYYEAGFARGLNRTVISCCREDDLKNLHFDTKPINHIVWKDPADLREKLKNRILATAPSSR